MAFVFNKQRWGQPSKKLAQNVGPGYYFKENSNEKIKYAYISPQKTTSSSKGYERSQQTKQQRVIQLVLNQKQRNCGNTKRNYGKIRSPTQYRRVSNGKENEIAIDKMIQTIQLKNKLPKRYLHTSQSHKQSKKRRDQIMKRMIQKIQPPSLCKDDNEALCVQVPQLNMRKSKSKLIQSRKKMSKLTHSYEIQAKSKQQKEDIINNLMINSCNKTEQPLEVRKIKTSQSNLARVYKKQRHIDSLPYKMQEEGPTGIEDDSQDSIEYIDDSTPGPGSYNLTTNMNTSKNIYVGKFGVTVKRFEEPKQTAKVYIQIKQPNFKKTTKAPQQFVAFGNSIRQQYQKQLPQGQMKFLYDKDTIQSKSCQNLLKSYYKPGFFLSKEDRFPQQKASQYFGPDYPAENDDESEQNQLIKPQATFLSKVKRIYKPHIQTLQVDYNGQDFNTIQKKIKGKLKQSQDIDRKPAGFLKDEPRFVQKAIVDEQPVRPLHEILKRKKKQSENTRGYTFRKGQYQNKLFINTENPSFTKYSCNKSWIKPSFNRKFQHLEA